eukprot:6865718-Alexandrium_andersonii.AAC.1
MHACCGPSLACPAAMGARADKCAHARARARTNAHSLQQAPMKLPPPMVQQQLRNAHNAAVACRKLLESAFVRVQMVLYTRNWV